MKTILVHGVDDCSRSSIPFCSAAGWKTACAVLLAWAATAIASPAQTFRILGNFYGGNGNHPGTDQLGSLVQGFDGNFYGTTLAGGAYGQGTVFKISRGGGLSTLYSFCAQTNCPDGKNPNTLLQGTDGNFYGTTFSGGIGGTVFKITRSGVLTTLYSGTNPTALVQATDGNFYGTTPDTIFKITPNGTLTTLNVLPVQSNFGGVPGSTALLQASDGNFYGTTTGVSAGTIFRFTPTGTVTVLHGFCSQTNCADGDSPHALLQATDGNFYGTTEGGGPSFGGEVFKITPNGTLTVLYGFNVIAPCADGCNGAALMQSIDGNFYGTTEFGGPQTSACPSGCGTVFRLTNGGTLTTLHSFDSTDGTRVTGLMQSTSGTFYGTAAEGGPYNGGTIFSLSTGPRWFVKTLPSAGKVGDTIQILGTNLTGATGVNFNSTPAPFTIISPTQIQTTVPSGATTGTVQVTMATFHLNSNPRFHVTPQITSFSPTSGPAGTVVTITGVSLGQTIFVNIGGVGASFTAVNDTKVTATVPTGATTGKTIRIFTTQGGTTTSSTTFTVTP